MRRTLLGKKLLRDLEPHLFAEEILLGQASSQGRREPLDDQSKAPIPTVHPSSFHLAKDHVRPHGQLDEDMGRQSTCFSLAAMTRVGPGKSCKCHKFQGIILTLMC